MASTRQNQRRNTRSSRKRAKSTKKVSPPPSPEQDVGHGVCGTDQATSVKISPVASRQPSPGSPDLEGEVVDTDADLVFQCGSCRSVVGDTQTEYEAHLDSKTLSLKAACGVKIEDTLLVSKSGFDVGCNYKVVVCEHCEHQLGRVYTSTTAELDNRRSTYTLDHSALISYQLGSCRSLTGKPAPPRPTRADTAYADAANRCGAGKGGAVTFEAFDALDVHVCSLTEATNKLTKAFEQNRNAISEIRDGVESNTASMNILRSGLEHTQNMILLWEERFRRFETNEKKLAKIESDCRRYDLCERRLSQLEEVICNVRRTEDKTRAMHAQTASMKVTPAIQKPTSSPGRTSSVRRRR